MPGKFGDPFISEAQFIVVVHSAKRMVFFPPRRRRRWPWDLTVLHNDAITSKCDSVRWIN